MEALLCTHASFQKLFPRSNFRRWHQDIKPANILVLTSTSNIVSESQYNLDFKLADFGTSHLTPIAASDTDQDTQGTRTYGKVFPAIVNMR